jgi:hypothetical protein
MNDIVRESGLPSNSFDSKPSPLATRKPVLFRLGRCTRPVGHPSYECSRLSSSVFRVVSFRPFYSQPPPAANLAREKKAVTSLPQDKPFMAEGSDCSPEKLPAKRATLSDQPGAWIISTIKEIIAFVIKARLVSGIILHSVDKFPVLVLS